MEYEQREEVGRQEGQDWATDKQPKALLASDWTTMDADIIICLTETKASHLYSTVLSTCDDS